MYIENFEKLNEIKVFVFRWRGIPSHSIYESGLNRKRLDAFSYRLKKRTLILFNKIVKIYWKTFRKGLLGHTVVSYIMISISLVDCHHVIWQLYFSLNTPLGLCFSSFWNLSDQTDLYLIDSISFYFRTVIFFQIKIYVWVV